MVYLMENIFSYAMDGPRIEYYIMYLTPGYVDLAMKLLIAFLDIQAILSTFLLLQADIRDKDGLEKVFASAR
jgi:hypothetical protein